MNTRQGLFKFSELFFSFFQFMECFFFVRVQKWCLSFLSPTRFSPSLYSNNGLYGFFSITIIGLAKYLSNHSLFYFFLVPLFLIGGVFVLLFFILFFFIFHFFFFFHFGLFFPSLFYLWIGWVGFSFHFP